MAIMAIMLAIAVPAAGGMNERWRLEEAAWRLATDMRRARQAAISTGKDTRFEFRWEVGDYRIFLPDETVKVKLPAGISYLCNNFPNRGTIYSFSITPLGAPSQGGTVGFKNGRGGKLYVIITPATGRVRVSPIRPE